jgi:membrane-anchored protein YejM (alkaline phosphatase superfamily)
VKKLCSFLAEDHGNTPFFAFMFFESPHAPYEFPEEHELEKDYLKKINYASVGPKDGPALKRRYMNACNHLDARLGEVFETVKKQGLEKNTIIVLVGDHGEEFFEKGRLGHNSTFSREQLHTPLAIYVPGVNAMQYSDMSSHHDIVPMLSPYFGVTSPHEDYSLGFNLLDGKSKREYTVVSSWNELFYVGKKHKILLPTTSISAVTNKFYDSNDKEIDGKEKFFSDNINTLMKIQIDSQRFYR